MRVLYELSSALEKEWKQVVSVLFGKPEVMTDAQRAREGIFEILCSAVADRMRTNRPPRIAGVLMTAAEDAGYEFVNSEYFDHIDGFSDDAKKVIAQAIVKDQAEMDTRLNWREVDRICHDLGSDNMDVRQLDEILAFLHKAGVEPRAICK